MHLSLGEEQRIHFFAQGRIARAMTFQVGGALGRFEFHGTLEQVANLLPAFGGHS